MIFVDTGAFVARHLAGDPHHRSAVTYRRLLEKEGGRLCTSNLVLREVLTLLARRAGYAFAAQRGRAAHASGWLVILRTDSEEEGEALKLFEEYADQKVTFTDCVSFVLMHRHKVRKVFGFDSHFEMAGFQRLPR